MQPAQGKSGSSSASNRQLKRWGPIIGVALVALIVVIVVVATSGGDDKKAATTTAAATSAAATTAPASTAAATTAPATSAAATTAPGSTAAGTTAAATTVPAKVTYPMSWTQAKEAGLTDQIDWGKRCDTSTGRLAVPDYFAPECYAPLPAGTDNGGATSPGVTATDINVVAYISIANDPIISYVTDAIKNTDTNAQIADTIKGLVKYYSTYYELYGRKVNLVTYEGTGIANDEVAARADAARIAEQYKPFVVLGGPALTSAFADELAARKVMCIGCTPGQPEQFYADRDPYVWGLDGGQEQKQDHVIEFIKKQLIGKNATHAGDQFTSTPRKFGLLYLESSGASKDLADKFAKKMEDAGAPLAATVAYALDPATIQQTASQAISKLKAAGVTTVIFSGDPVAPRDFTKEATAQEYSPEWLVAASTLVDTTAFARTYDQEQWKHAFGVTQLAARTDPTKFGSFALYSWFNGTPPPAKDTIGVLTPNPSLFFAVAQGVGPNLTPATFRDTLFASAPTRPGISQPSLSWGTRDFWPGITDYLGVDDATEFWWNPTATGPDEIRKDGTGMYAYVDGGKRYLPGQWPTEDKLFQPDGAVTLYTTPPPGESPGSYPSPAGG